MNTFMQDLRYGVRILLKSPGFTGIAILSVALGISANATVFSWIQAVLLRPLPGVQAADRMAALETLTPTGEPIDSSYPDYRDYRDRSTLLSGVIAFAERPFSMGRGQDTERVWAQIVSGNYFDVLGVQPALGRFFSPEEQQEKPGAYPVVVLSHALWQRRFNRDASIVGRTVLLNHRECTVIGVAPAAFTGTMTGLALDLWVPAMMDNLLTGSGAWLERRSSRPLHVMARLKAGIGLEEARAEIQTIARQLAQTYPNTNAGLGATLVPVQEAPYGAQSVMSGLLMMLMGTVGVVLLIVCANVANLLLARGASRARELNIRLALGACRSRLVRQLLTESLLLSLTGGAVGALFAFWTVDFLTFFVPATDLPVSLRMTVDPPILGFTLLLSLLTGLLFGLAPAVQAMRNDGRGALKEGSRGATADRGPAWLRGSLVAVEVALALVALICAGLFIQSFDNARHADPGFDADRVLLAGVSLSAHGYDRDQGRQFYARLRTRLETTPGVEGVSFAEDVPLGFDGGSWEDIRIDGYIPEAGENMKIYRNVVDRGYFDVMGISMIQGRDFTDRDDLENIRVMIVNETFVRRFMPGRNPIGRTVKAWGGRTLEIVGVVRDIKHRRLNEPPKPYFYVPLRQFYWPDMGIAVHVRTAGAPAAFSLAVQRAVQAVDPDVWAFAVLPLSEWIGAAVFTHKVAAALLSVLGGLALLLAMGGVYGVMAYTVSQRTQEIGIRMALGARPADILAMMIRQGMRMAGIGLAAGMAGALAATRWIASLLYGVSATDPLTFAGITLLLTGIALFATYLPARRATRVDPMVALRYE